MVTPLDSSCSSVLGYNWLKQFNRLIDWFSGHISFRSVDHRGLALSTDPPKPPLVNAPSDPIPNPLPKVTPPHISFINASAYMCTTKLPRSVSFQLQISPEGVIEKPPQWTQWTFNSWGLSWVCWHFQQRKSWCSPSTLSLQPQNRFRWHSSLPHVLHISIWTRNPTIFYWWACQPWLYLTLEIPTWCSYPFHQKEGW